MSGFRKVRPSSAEHLLNYDVFDEDFLLGYVLRDAQFYDTTICSGGTKFFQRITDAWVLPYGAPALLQSMRCQLAQSRVVLRANDDTRLSPGITVGVWITSEKLV